MTDPRGVSASRAWRLLCDDEWLLLAVLAFVENDGDEIHCLWLLALDDELSDLCGLLEHHFSLSVDHALRVAMVHSMWSVLLQFAGTVKSTTNQRLSEATVDRIHVELERVGAAPHPHRRLALWTAVGFEHKHPRQSSSSSCHRCGKKHIGFCVVRGSEFTAPGESLPHVCRGLLPYVMTAAAREGVLESVVWLHHVACYRQSTALTEAARNGHVQVVLWLLDRPHHDIVVDLNDWDKSDNADGGLQVIAWRDTRTKQCYTWTNKWGYGSWSKEYAIASHAVRDGDVEAVRQLHAHPFFGPRFNWWVAYQAVLMGNQLILAFLLEQCPHVFRRPYVDDAIKNGHMEVAKWMVSNGCGKLDASVVKAAVQYGDHEVLEWVLQSAEDPASIDQVITTAVAYRSTLSGLRWLVEKRGLVVDAVTHGKMAIRDRNVELTKWVVHHCITNGTFSHGELLLEKAIKKGSFELVQWFIEDLGIWSPQAFYFASARPNTEVLAYVYQKALLQQPQSTRVQVLVPKKHMWLDRDCLQTLEWLLAHGFRSGLFRQDTLPWIRYYEQQHASTQRRVEKRSPYEEQTIRRLRALMRHVIDVYDPTFLREVQWLPQWAARYGGIPSLQRLVAIGHEHVFSRKAFDSLLLRSSDESVVKWFLEQKPALFTTLVVRWAIAHSKRGIFAWIFQTFLPSRFVDEKTIRKCVGTALSACTRYSRTDMMIPLQQWRTPNTNDDSWFKSTVLSCSASTMDTSRPSLYSAGTHSDSSHNWE